MKQRKALSILLKKFVLRKSIIRKYMTNAVVLLLFIYIAFVLLGKNNIQAMHEYLNDLSVATKMMVYNVTHATRHITAYFDVIRENEILKEELSKLNLSQAKESRILEELNELKKILNIKYNSAKFDVTEKVLGYSKSIFSSNIIISKTHKITQEDSIALAPEGLVGLVVSNHNKVAEILPITSSRIAIPVKTKSEMHLIISGNDWDKMVVKEMREGKVTSLTAEDILYTSGEGGIYPKDIPVASVTETNANRNEITITPLAKINKLDYVFIIEPITLK